MIINNLLTDVQQETFDFIKNFVSLNKYPPTVRDIARKFNITVRAAKDRLVGLEKKNKIKRMKKIARGIIIIDE